MHYLRYFYTPSLPIQGVTLAQLSAPRLLAWRSSFSCRVISYPPPPAVVTPRSVSSISFPSDRLPSRASPTAAVTQQGVGQPTTPTEHLLYQYRLFRVRTAFHWPPIPHWLPASGACRTGVDVGPRAQGRSLGAASSAKVSAGSWGNFRPRVRHDASLSGHEAPHHAIGRPAIALDHVFKLFTRCANQ